MSGLAGERLMRVADITVMVLLGLVTIAPMAMLTFLAFTTEWGVGGGGGFTLTWFKLIPERFGDSIGNSLMLAVITMVLTLVVSGITAYVVITKKIRATRFVDAMMMMPLTVSYIVLGLALILTYNRPPLAIHGTVWLLIIGHMVITLPLSYRIVQAVMEGIDLSLIEAARSLGASEFAAVRKVILPAVAPGLVAAGLLAFVQSLQNYSMSLMVAPDSFKTLPLDLVGFIFSESGAYANFNLAAAVSLFLMLMIVGALWMVRLVTKQTWFENLNF